MTSTGQGLPRRKKTASPAQTSIDGQYAVEASRGPVSRSLKATDFPSREDRQMPKPKRYAAGRARALGLPTRGTTNPYRLRRVDRHLAQVHADLLRTAATPLVIDLDSGEKPITAVELHLRLSEVRPDVQVVGLEIDPDRVAAAQSATRDRLAFRYGGFELAGLRPLVVRAFNVLRQYEESTAHEAWTTIVAGLQDEGLLMEGTCDELGRRAAWVTLTKEGPQTLTLAAHLQTLDRPGRPGRAASEGTHPPQRAKGAPYTRYSPSSTGRGTGARLTRHSGTGSAGRRCASWWPGRRSGRAATAR